MKMEEDDSDERITPFMIFMVENRERILRKNPNASLAQLGRLVYEAWQGLSPEMMHGYSMLSETYNANITKQKNGTAVRRKRTREKDPEAPKAGAHFLALSAPLTIIFIHMIYKSFLNLYLLTFFDVKSRVLTCTTRSIIEMSSRRRTAT